MKIAREAAMAAKPDYKIFWGNTKPEVIAALKREAEAQTRFFKPFSGETPEEFAIRVWACGFLYSREFYAEAVALRQAGWPPDPSPPSPRRGKHSG
ncbi:MAG TPA: hypothetical protein VN496_00470 [Burkholderiales bacterium]|nr:hypothetical protein [Burkholderiales bacterium]